MKFYEVLVASMRFHGSTGLTYSSSDALKVGMVVRVPLQNTHVLGIIEKQIQKPTFKTKPIESLTQFVVPQHQIELIYWLQSYYPAPLGQIVSLFIPSNLMQKSAQTKPNSSAAKRIKNASLPPLTDEQAQVVNNITTNKQLVHLLHGETGTGKTRVYIEMLLKCLQNKQSALVLTPEIGLTPQLAQSISATFTQNVYILHSGLTPAQRKKRWQAIACSKDPVIAIGPRSALFAPIHNLGLIILDEVHDDAYKQEQAPHYVASRVAGMLAAKSKAKLIFGSATPLVADYYTFSQKQLPIHRMQRLATGGDHATTTTLLDLRNKSEFTKSNWLSNSLIEAMGNAIRTKAQILIFLNRRGSARLVVCNDCGWQATCPRCDVALTYHGDTHNVRCHTCGYHVPAVGSCPSCASTDVLFKSVGTKAIAAELKKLFPNARLARFDSDNKKAEKLNERYDELVSGDIDIIVGTQLLTKGLDLPKLGLVGVISADTSLAFPDYTAEERTYQMLSQVIGRAQRGHRDTEVIIQTFQPENATIQHAISKNYSSFYEQQLEQRKTFGFPPFRHILKITLDRSKPSVAKQAALRLQRKLQDLPARVEILDASPAFAEKQHGRYRWQIIVKAVARQELLKVVAELPSNTSYDLDPTNLL